MAPTAEERMKLSCFLETSCSARLQASARLIKTVRNVVEIAKRYTCDGVRVTLAATYI